MADAWAIVHAAIALVGAAIAYFLRSDRVQGVVATISAVLHLGLTAFVIFVQAPESGSGLFALDALGKPVLLLVSMLYLSSSVYDIGYLRVRRGRDHRIFYACQQALVGALTLVVWSSHLGVTWVAMEASALAVAPLIYFDRNPRSIEGTWKYLLVSSVGMALALLGSFFLAYGSLQGAHAAGEISGSAALSQPSLAFPSLLAGAKAISRPWLDAAWVLLLVGYGTKLGLAPMHTWKPDAYGEAPGVVGALLAGGVTAGAFLTLARIFHVCDVAGAGASARDLLVLMGVISMATAAVFLAAQRDLKRLLAYSSVEHMGILAIGLGVGGVATYGAMLHLIANGLIKGALFMAAGNIQRSYLGKHADGLDGGAPITGILRRLPLTGVLLAAGFFAVTASPPFPIFLSELAIVQGTIASGRLWTAAAMLVALAAIFLGMGRTILGMLQGAPPTDARIADPEHCAATRDNGFTVGPGLVLLLLVTLLGLGLAPWLDGLAVDAAESLR